MSVDDAVRVGAHLADALDRLHQQGEVHGRVTSDAIWLDGPDVTLAPPKVGPIDADGLAAPEVLDGDPPDARSDHFALGCVLYEMVAGRPAYAAGTGADDIRAGQVTPIARYQPLAPPSFVRLVATCLQPDPQDRWQSAKDLGRELAWVGTLDEAASERLEDDTRASNPRLYGLTGLAAGFVLSGAFRACG
jgi:hypothetical protein